MRFNVPQCVQAMWQNEKKRTLLCIAIGYMLVLLCGAGAVYYWRVLYGLDTLMKPAAATLAVCALLSALYGLAVAVMHGARRWLPVQAAVLVLGAGLCFAAANPPLQAPDEVQHFVRAYSLGSGTFVFDQHEDYPEDVDALVQAFPGFYYSECVLAQQQTVPQGFAQYRALLQGSTPLTVRASTATQQFLYYLPQAAGVAFGRLLGLRALGMMYAARIVNLLCYAVLCGFAVFFASRFVPLFIAAMISPPALFIAASCSPDALFLGAGWLFIGLCLAEHSTVKRAVLLVTSFVLAYCTKNTALALLPLILLLPVPFEKLRLNKLCFRLRPWQSRAVMMLVCTVAAMAMYALLQLYTTAFSNYGRIPYGLEGIDGAAQWRLVLQNPLRYTVVMLYSLYRDKANLFSAGAFGWLDMVEPFVGYFTPLLWAVAAGMCGADAAQSRLRTAGVFGLAAALMYAFTYTGMYLTSTPVSLPEINGVQMRYLLNVMPLMFAAAAVLIVRVQQAAGVNVVERLRGNEAPARCMLYLSYGYAVVSAALLVQGYYLKAIV